MTYNITIRDETYSSEPFLIVCVRMTHTYANIPWSVPCSGTA